jgi:HEPN domain-containing protein
MIKREALLWFKQAEMNLRKTLNDLLTRDRDSAAFWSQQAVEKALKALLLNAEIVHRGHNLLEIAEVIKKELNIDVEEISCKIRIVFLT